MLGAVVGLRDVVVELLARRGSCDRATLDDVDAVVRHPLHLAHQFEVHRGSYPTGVHGDGARTLGELVEGDGVFLVTESALVLDPIRQGEGVAGDSLDLGSTPISELDQARPGFDGGLHRGSVAYAVGPAVVKVGHETSHESG